MNTEQSFGDICISKGNLGCSCASVKRSLSACALQWHGIPLRASQKRGYNGSTPMARFRNGAVLFLCATLLFDYPSHAGPSWPMFRGSQDLTGVVKDGQSAPIEPLHLRWTFKTGGPVKSSAAIVDNRVIAGSSDGSIVAIDLSTGKALWDFKTEGPVESSPLVLNGVVYAGSVDSNLYALDAVSGTLKWKYKTGDKIMGAPNWAHTAAGDCILVGSYDNNVHCVNAATGKAIWTYDTANYVNGAPAFGDGRVVFGGCDAKIHAVGIADGKLLKEVDATAYIAGSCAVQGKFAYAGHYGNQVIAVDLEQGKTIWTYEDSEDAYFSTPAITDSRVLIGGRDKKLHCLDRATGKSVWAFSTQGSVDSSPVVCGNRVVFGSDDGRLYVVNLNDGKECWSYEIGKPLASSPAIVDGVVVIGADDGCVYAFSKDVKK